MYRLYCEALIFLSNDVTSSSSGQLQLSLAQPRHQLCTSINSEGLSFSAVYQYELCYAVLFLRPDYSTMSRPGFSVAGFPITPALLARYRAYLTHGRYPLSSLPSADLLFSRRACDLHFFACSFVSSRPSAPKVRSRPPFCIPQMARGPSVLRLSPISHRCGNSPPPSAAPVVPGEINCLFLGSTLGIVPTGP